MDQDEFLQEQLKTLTDFRDRLVSERAAVAERATPYQLARYDRQIETANSMVADCEAWIKEGPLSPEEATQRAMEILKNPTKLDFADPAYHKLAERFGIGPKTDKVQ